MHALIHVSAVTPGPRADTSELTSSGRIATIALGSAPARVAELADAQDLGSCGVTRPGSTPGSRNLLASITLFDRESDVMWRVPRVLH